MITYEFVKAGTREFLPVYKDREMLETIDNPISCEIGAFPKAWLEANVECDCLMIKENGLEERVRVIREPY